MASPAIQRVLAPRTLLVGGGAVARLGEVVAQTLRRSRPLVVTDETLATKTDAVEKVARALSASLPSFSAATDVSTATIPDPTTASVDALVAKLGAAEASPRRRRYDCVVAVGGGSPMDSAKAACALVEFGGAMRDYKAPFDLSRELTRVPIIAVPTTAGTGSEVTRFAVVTDSDTGEKMLCAGAAFVPAAAVVDYELTLSAPWRLTADTGIDALCHAMEAYVSKRANWYSDAMATSAMSAIGANARAACAGAPEARAAMMRAATQAGLAFSNASVTLIHGMSRPIGAYFHVPHGLSNAMLAPDVTAFSLPGALDRYADVARLLLGSGNSGERTAADAAARLPEALAALNRDLEVPTLRAFLGGPDDRFEALVPTMATDALNSGSPLNNPLVPEHADIEALYRQIYQGG
mmetsp:Transcript_25126/g.99991  ORF Transcript_25126/g.99991 Transcript_25126/m.99991 type:complete len:409 (+) Transcript_25126:898-2124(+)